MKTTAILLAAAMLGTAGGAMAQNAPPATARPAGNIPRPEAGDAMKISDRDREMRTAADRIAREIRERDAPARPRGRVVAASAKDLIVGAEVHAFDGPLLGAIELVDAGGVQILTADGKCAKVPAEGFGKGKAGLILNMTKQAFDQAVAASLAQ